jgi:hypothetical protein
VRTGRAQTRGRRDRRMEEVDEGGEVLDCIVEIDIGN